MPKQSLGIELGSQSLALVQLTGAAKAYDITAAVYQPLPPQDDPEDQLRVQQQTLEDLLDTHRLRGDTLVVTLPASHAVLRNLMLPFRDSRRIRQVIKFTLDERMPFEPDEVVADFQILPSTSGEQTPILAAAVSQDLIANTLEMLQTTGLEPSVIDFDVFSLANATLLGAPAPPMNTVLIDVQPARTLLTILDQGAPVFARSWAYGWPQAHMSLETYANRLDKQVQHTLYAYENVLDHPYEVERLVLSGAAEDDLAPLADILQHPLGIPVEPWRLTAEAYRAASTPLASVSQAGIAVAFGAAIRGLDRQAVGLNLRRERFVLHQDLQELRGRLVGVGCFLMLLAGMGMGSLYIENHFKTQRLSQLNAYLEEVFRSTLPGTRLIQPVAQMQGKVQEISDRLRAFGGVTGAQLTGLQLLREISARVPPELALNVETLAITDNSVDMGGNVGSYKDLDNLEAALKAAPAIANVEVNSAKKEANRVTFQLTITLAKTLDNVS